MAQTTKISKSVALKGKPVQAVQPTRPTAPDQFDLVFWQSPVRGLTLEQRAAHEALARKVREQRARSIDHPEPAETVRSRWVG